MSTDNQDQPGILPEGEVVPVSNTPAATPESPVPPAAQEEGHDSWKGLPPHEPSKNVVQEHETYNPDLSSGPLDPSKGEFLILPADTEDRVDQYDRDRPNEQLGETDGERSWGQKILDGEMTRPVDRQFQSSVARDGSDWGNSIKSQQGELIAARPRLNAPGESMVTGARAVQRVRALLGMGSLIQVPLWNSGFWATFRAPSESDLLDLFRRMSEEKVTLGRRTYGLAFANSSSFIAREVMQFAMEHLHDSTLKSTLDVRKYMKVHDLQTVAWALACVIFPKGFQYSRSVLSGENEEKREVKGLLNVTKLQFVDRSVFTEWQVSHMAKRMGNTMTDEMLERYQNEFTLRERRVELEEGLFMTLSVPSIDGYISSGHRWIDSITDMVDRSFQQPASDEVRDRYISHQGKASVMRQFVHWVKNLIEVNADGSEVVFDDTETLDMMMNTLSQHDGVRDAYFKAVHQFIDDTTISVIATPTVNAGEENKLPRYPKLVPIDALYTFFILLAQKNSRIQARMAL